MALFGTPMGAFFFTDLADRLAGAFTVLTTDVRGIGSSTVDDPAALRRHDAQYHLQ